MDLEQCIAKCEESQTKSGRSMAINWREMLTQLWTTVSPTVVRILVELIDNIFPKEPVLAGAASDPGPDSLEHALKHACETCCMLGRMIEVQNPA